MIQLRRRLLIILAAITVGITTGFAMGNVQTMAVLPRAAAPSPARQGALPQGPPAAEPQGAPPQGLPAAEPQRPPPPQAAERTGGLLPISAGEPGSHSDPNADIPTSPLPKVPPEERIRKVPILMYHELGDVGNGLYVRVAEFGAHLEHIAANGYHPVTLEDVYRHFAQGRPLPPKPVVITFDDGYRTFWDVAVPMLEAYKYPATVFVVTGLVGKPNYLTWEHVRALPGMGFEIGSHTETHPDLRRLSGARLAQEVTGARTVLERQTGELIRFFCYPSGRYDDETLEAVRAAGYVAAVTTRYGPATPDETPLLWSRIRVDRRDTLAGFARKLAEASQ